MRGGDSQTHPRPSGDQDAKDAARRRPRDARSARSRRSFERSRDARAPRHHVPRRRAGHQRHASSTTAPAGDSVGDTLGFGNTIYDAANATAIGSDGGQCVRTVPGVSWECAFTTSLKNGQITVEGPFLDAGDSTLSITGGTGAYRKARGTMDLHARDATGSAFDFTFHVLG